MPEASDQLHELAERLWYGLSESSPTESLLRGDHRFDTEIENPSRDSENQAIEFLENLRSEVEAIDASQLTANQEITRRILHYETTVRAEEKKSRHLEIDINPVMGFHIDFPSSVSQFPITEPEHAYDLVEKYRKVAGALDKTIKRWRQGIAGERTPTADAVTKVIAQVDGLLEVPIQNDLYLQVRHPPAFDDAQLSTWKDTLRTILVDDIRPAYQRFRDALEHEVLPKSRRPENPGLCWLPDGEEVYFRSIARHTTLDMTPMEIHRIGLDAIETLNDEYRELGNAVLGTSDLGGIYDRLRNDPALRFADSNEVRACARTSLERACRAIPQWFGRLPKADCVVVNIPEVAARDSTIAYYLPPAADGSRPGSYYVNVSEPTTRTLFESEALAFHESIPGHHLQIAIAQELEGIPDIRRHTWITAYGEGWGLYAERLSDEMGLYTGDMERLGILSFDSWRAGRLVVDTGMHALGWSKQEAIDFLMQNSPQAANNIVNEVERYIAWPGQALAYKIGQRHIVHLRNEAQTRLGNRFDIKGFHDIVLANGSVPLPLLGDLVSEWIAMTAATDMTNN